jgi:pSer/pThr/pTyr-binding forkhead associated (FHA) protein
MTLYWLKHKGTLFPIHQGDCLLGRSPECPIVLASERVSREHAVVRRIHSGLEIEDLASRNGTWVNGARIRYRTVLQPGDEIELGEDLLEVVIQQNARVPETVSGVASPVSQETERQRQALEQVEMALARLDPAEDIRAAAHRFRPAVDQLIERQAEWGPLLAPEETRRLAKVARTLALWADNGQLDRWVQDVLQQLARDAPAVD